eukprot:5450533-Pyramimonas_sp.AAC.1
MSLLRGAGAPAPRAATPSGSPTCGAASPLQAAAPPPSPPPPAPPPNFGHPCPHPKDLDKGWLDKYNWYKSSYGYRAQAPSLLYYVNGLRVSR